MSYGLGIALGAASKSFSEGIRDVENMQDIASKQQTREIQAKAEERAATRFGNEQADRAAEAAAHASVAASLEGRQEAVAAPTGVPSDMSGRMNLGGPKGDGTGVSYDVGEGETVRAGVTTERTTRTPGATGVPAPRPVSGNVTGIPRMDLSVDQATKIYKQNPNKFTRAIFERAQAQEVERLKYQADRYDQQYVNDLRSAQASDIRANTEATRVRTAIARTKVSSANLEATRAEVEARSRLAGAQVQNLTEGIGLTEAENAGKTEPIVANVVAGMNATNKTLGFKTSYKAQDGGYSLVTTDDSGKVVGTQLVRTVGDLKKLVAVGGTFSMPDKWTEYQGQASLAQQEGLLEEVARIGVDAQKVKAELGIELTKTELAQAKGASVEMGKLREMLSEPGALLEREPEIRGTIDRISAMVPSMVFATRTVETIDPATGEKIKKKVQVNTLLERYDAMRPKTDLEVSDKKGNVKTVDLRSVAVAVGYNWDDTLDEVRKANKLDKTQEPTPQMIDQYLQKEVASKAPDPRARRYLLNLIYKTREEREKAAAEAAAAPQSAARDTSRPGIAQAWRNLWAPIPPDPSASRPPARGRGVTVVPQEDPALINRMQHQR